MGLNSGVRVDRINALIARFSYEEEQLPAAVGGAMADAAGRGSGVMANRITTAETITGQKRVAKGGLGPGRIKTGAMIRSLTENGQPFRLAMNGSRVHVEFGYLGFNRANERQREQIEMQEYEYYSISGQLNALQLGFNEFQMRIHRNIADEWRALDEDARAGRFERRAAKASERGRALQALVTGSAPGLPPKRRRGRPKKAR